MRGWLPQKRASPKGSSWSARSRAAARTNELGAGQWRQIIGSGEGGRVRLAYQGRLPVPGAWLAEWSRKHPSGAAPACGLNTGQRLQYLDSRVGLGVLVQLAVDPVGQRL